MKNISTSPISYIVGMGFCTVFLTAAHAQSLFSGEWKYTEHTNMSKVPYLTFDIKLTQNKEGKINGSYCIITQTGNRIDCDPDSDALNIAGWGEPNNSSAEIHFYSFFGAKNGIAKLSLVGDELIWLVTKNPDGGFFYGPYKAKLMKAPENNHSDERQVVVDKAHLYNSPSTSSATNAYVVKGDYVQLLKISDDLKFWKIRYVRAHKTAIERWIDCRAIDFCP